MKYSPRVSNTFDRELRRLRPTDRNPAWDAIQQIQESPFSHKAPMGRLSGTRAARAGDLRIMFAVNEDENRIILLHVGHRERVYEH